MNLYNLLFLGVKDTTPQPEVVAAAPTPVVVVEKKPVTEKTAIVEVPVQSVITNGGKGLISLLRVI